MTISKKMLDAPNEQLELEEESARLCESLAAYFHSLNPEGTVQWVHPSPDQRV